MGNGDQYFLPLINSSLPDLAAFIALDGNLYVVNHSQIDTTRGKVLGTDSTTYYASPKLVFQAHLQVY